MSAIINILKKKEAILILGFGREGQSTYNFIRGVFPCKTIFIGDENEHLNIKDEVKADIHTKWILGNTCYNNLDYYDMIIKSPGIPMRKVNVANAENVTSQTDLFLQEFHKQTIGISGTKGKSTTTSLIWHMLNQSGEKTLLAGNIGIPAFDLIDKMDNTTMVVMELSAHQGEILQTAPGTMVLLNIYQEHLDHFGDFSNYRNAKLNFCMRQNTGDTFIYYEDDPLLSSCYRSVPGVKYISISNKNQNASYVISDIIIRGESYSFPQDHNPLKGKHNLINIAAAIATAQNMGLSHNQINNSIQSFRPLEHRLEYVGKYKETVFYNDSISTVPEATIAAVDALKNVRYLILGGFDRGIDYRGLVRYLKEKTIADLLLTGEAGKRIAILTQSEGIPSSRVHNMNSITECVRWVASHSIRPGICLLSPAASSYDAYNNFEERGKDFKTSINNLHK